MVIDAVFPLVLADIARRPEGGKGDVSWIMLIIENVLNDPIKRLQMDNLKRLIDELKAISFWQRLFGWKRVTNLLVDAAADMQNLAGTNANLVNANNEQKINSASIKEELRNTAERKSQLEIELERLKANFTNLQREHGALKEIHTQLTTEEEARRNKYNTDVALLNTLTTQIQAERAAEQQAKTNATIESIQALKETWNRHEEFVKSIIRGICNRHVIEYVDKVAFKGEPDNTLKICDEFIVFDAKSPGSDDLTNFPAYLKDQAEKAKKYAKQEGVKKDVFFVVPTNTLATLKQFVYNLGDYDVFIISADSLEQIILSLKKIEEYEFAEKLSPEERDNICRLLGKFAHLTKRRIQIDSFFAKQFIELAYRSEADLPKEFLDKVIEFERSEKLNPPQEKRAKAISTKELDKDATQLKTEIMARGIIVDDEQVGKGIDLLGLYRGDSEEPI